MKPSIWAFGVAMLILGIIIGLRMDQNRIEYWQVEAQNRQTLLDSIYRSHLQ